MAIGLLPVAAAGGAYLLLKKKGGSKITKGLDMSKGVAAEAAKGVGVKTFVNVLDKVALGGRMTALGISYNVAGMNIGLNATDLVAYFLLNGLKFDKKTLIRGLEQIGPAKIAEAKNWIDPPNVSGDVPSSTIYSQPIAGLQIPGGH